MEKLQIQTSQNIAIDHTVASAGERILSYILDYCFIIAYAFVFMVLPAIFKVQSGVYYLLMLIPVIFYDLFFENVYNGQSPGKIIMGIKVVMIRGTAPVFFNYFIRWVFRIIDNLLLSGAIATITILLNGKGQRLGDIAAGTTVIKIRKKINAGNLIYLQVPDDYKLVYESVNLLQENDLRIIKETLTYQKENPKSENYQTIAESIRTKIDKKMGAQSKQHILAYLQTVLNDYNFLNK